MYFVDLTSAVTAVSGLSEVAVFFVVGYLQAGGQPLIRFCAVLSGPLLDRLKTCGSSGGVWWWFWFGPGLFP